MKKLLLFSAVVMLSVVGVACSEEPEATDTGTDTTTEDGGGAAAATVTAADAKFDPELLSVAAGSTIEFVNEDDFEHSFTVKGTDVHEELEEAGTVEVDLSSLETGSHEFFCEYHPDTMTGTLEVTP